MRIIAILTILTIINFSCSNKVQHEKKIQYPFTYVDTKTETKGENENKMDLYVADNKLNLDTLKMFCADRKKTWTEGTFYFVVVFDKKENAVFPTNPLTGLYSEDEPLKHIRAIYTYCRLNGYSKLNFYAKNKFESVVEEIDI